MTPGTGSPLPARGILNAALFGDIKKGREVELDALRGIAILLAMGWHFNNVETGFLFLDGLLWPGRAFGWAGVDLFFVLSGFLIGRLILGEIADTGTIDIKRFYVRRILRLWPSLYLFILAMVVLSGRPASTFAPQIGLHVQNFFPPGLATHLWSLAVEEHFYLLLAAFVVWVPKSDVSFQSVERLCFAIMIVCPAFRLLAVHFEVEPRAIQWQTQFRIDALASGLLLATYNTARPEIFDLLRKMKLALWSVVALGLIFIVQVDKASELGAVFGYTIAYAAAAAFLLLVYKSRVLTRPRMLADALASLGIYSYAMYIWHVPISAFLKAGLEKLEVPNDGLTCVVAAYLITFAIAVVSTRALERPILLLRDVFFPRVSLARTGTRNEATISTAL